jgi:divalent metal cation (Fe/Co/Zn/Cd) transporter
MSFNMMFFLGTITGIIICASKFNNPLLDILIGVGIYIIMFIIANYFVNIRAGRK